MKVSFLIVNYNTAYYLGNLIESISKRIDMNDKEILVYDNGSNLEDIVILKLIEESNKKVKIIYDKENRGVGYAFNKLIDKAKSDFLIRLDSDTVIVENGFDDKLIAVFEEKEHIGVVTCKTNRTSQPSQIVKMPEVFSNNIDKTYMYFTDTLNKKEADYILFDKNDKEYLAGYCFVFKKSDLLKYGIKFNDELLCYGEDNIFIKDMYNAGFKAVIHNKVFIWHYQGGSTKNMDKKILEDIKIKAQKAFNSDT